MSLYWYIYLLRQPYRWLHRLEVVIFVDDTIYLLPDVTTGESAYALHFGEVAAIIILSIKTIIFLAQIVSVGLIVLDINFEVGMLVLFGIFVSYFLAGSIGSFSNGAVPALLTLALNILWPYGLWSYLKKRKAMENTDS